MMRTTRPPAAASSPLRTMVRPTTGPPSSASPRGAASAAAHAMNVNHPPMNHQEANNAVVAALEGGDPKTAATAATSSTTTQSNTSNPYSAIALSWDRQYAVTACKDTLQILAVDTTGLSVVKTLPMAHHFHPVTAAGAATTTGNDPRGGPTTRSSNSDASSRRGDVSVLTAFSSPFSITGHSVVAGGPQPAPSALFNVVITDVAWSPPLQPNKKSSTTTPAASTTNMSISSSVGGGGGSERGVGGGSERDYHHHDSSGGGGSSTPRGAAAAGTTSAAESSTAAGSTSRAAALTSSGTTATNQQTTTLIAAAASNGVIVVWNAEALLASPSSSGGRLVQPEAVLRQHVRAVNRLDWHPAGMGLLLSASQDGKVLLWERQKQQKQRSSTAPTASTTPQQQQQQQHSDAATSFGLHRFFGGPGSSLGISSAAKNARASVTWHCRHSFEPKSEAVRDIRWNPFFDDVFALVSASGSLIVYNISLPRRALVKLTAHAGDATCCDWHPKMPGMIATGGAADRCVKIWNLEQQLLMEKDEAFLFANQNTVTSRADSIATESSTDNDSSINLGATGTPQPTLSQNSFRTMSSSSAALNASRHNYRGNTKNLLHVLSISASVTRLRWRPLAADLLAPDDSPDRHESMIAVATAPVKGASSGGAGLLMLWSWNRPFMPLSVVEGHKEGAVTDFHWLDTPRRAAKKRPDAAAETGVVRVPGSHTHEVDAILFENSDHGEGESDEMGIWQHVLSVGRDGRCLIQSFVRGDRPISRVPPSCFAMANLSPFQAGYGSLQIFSVCQSIPSGPRNEYLLTGLRRDIVTASAPGIFREELDDDEYEIDSTDGFITDKYIENRQLPTKVPELHFNIIDQGDLDDNMQPITDNGTGIMVAPEVVHMSRFASGYELYLREDKCKTRVELCLHNADVAQSLRYAQIAEMWKMVAAMLENSGTDCLPTSGAEAGNVMQFVLLPTIRSALLERADAGDVQTCVALCEVFEVVTPQETVRIPDIDLELVREWYLAYIDLLQGMCLFSHATFLIKHCSDPFIAALNKQSTTIHESCPQCRKPLLTSDGADSSGHTSTARRLCKSCRRRIGFCFLCHEPVKGMYVWCPGCGHGGHLEHALEWFGGPSGKPVREVCPTGCGHKCNMMKRLTAFPRTESMKETQ